MCIAHEESSQWYDRIKDSEIIKWLVLFKLKCIFGPSSMQNLRFWPPYFGNSTFCPPSFSSFAKPCPPWFWLGQSWHVIFFIPRRQPTWILERKIKKNSSLKWTLYNSSILLPHRSIPLLTPLSFLLHPLFSYTNMHPPSSLINMVLFFISITIFLLHTQICIHPSCSLDFHSIQTNLLIILMDSLPFKPIHLIPTFFMTIGILRNPHLRICLLRFWFPDFVTRSYFRFSLWRTFHHLLQLILVVRLTWEWAFELVRLRWEWDLEFGVNHNSQFNFGF